MPHVPPSNPGPRPTTIDGRGPIADPKGTGGGIVDDNALAAAMKHAEKTDADNDGNIDKQALVDLKVYADRYAGHSFSIEPLREALHAATILSDAAPEAAREDVDVKVRTAIDAAFAAAEQIGKRWP